MQTLFRRVVRWVTGLSYHRIILIGLSLGMVLSIVLFYSVWRQEYTYAVANFHLEARTAAAAVQQSLEYGAHDLAATRSLYRASAEVTRSEFTDFITDQLAANPLPGLKALEWIPYVPASQRAAYEQSAQDEGFPHFQFTERDKEGRLVRAGDRAEYYPVYYVAPQDGLEYILGFDLGSDASRLNTIQQARDTGQPAVTGPVVLAQSPTDAKGSLIFMPIYETGQPPATVEERRKQLRGFLLGVFDLQMLLTADRNPGVDAGYDLYLVDPTQPPGQQLIMFRPAGPSVTPAPVAATRATATTLDHLRTTIHHMQEVAIGDRRWQLVIVPGPGQIAAAFSSLPLITMLAVFAISALATAYLARRRQVQEILQKNEQQYRLVTDNIADVIWAADASSMKLTFVTPSIEKLLDVSVEETTRRPLHTFIAPDSAAFVQTVLPQRIAAAQAGVTSPYIDELALLRHDGSLVWTETTSYYATEPQTQRLQIYGISRDNTERRRIARTQAAQFAVSRILAQSPELQHAIVQVLESLTLGLDWLAAEFWQRSEDGSRIVWGASWSRPNQPQIEQFLRLSTAYSFVCGEGLIGRTWQDNQALWENNLTEHPEYPRHQIGAAAGLRSAVTIPVCINDDVLGIMAFHSASERPVDDWLLETLLDLGRQIGQFIARKQAEIELQNERSSLARGVQERTADLSKANAELAHAVRAKDEFLANMSHELRTPLNGVLAMAESLQEGTYGLLNSRQQRSIAMVAQSGSHLLTLINDILDLSKVEAGKLDLLVEPVSAVSVSQASLALVQEMAIKKNIHLAFASNDDGAELQADRRRLKQILVNLLSNAIKFTPDGGHVTLTVTVKPQACAMEFAVQDDGIGIAPADQSKLFQPFTQLDASLTRHYEGTGLGLALVRRLAELHGGCVSVTSSGIRGQGSRFTVEFPWEDIVPDSSILQHPDSEHPADEHNALATGTLSAGEIAQAPTQPVVATAKPWQGAKILVVDDNELNLLALEDYLRNAGFQLSFAHDGEQALQKAQEVGPDLILMDIQMPKISGIEATRLLRATPRFASTPILALTALAMPGDRELCLEAGANDYIAKPFLLKDLVKIIQRWLEHAAQTNNPL